MVDPAKLAQDYDIWADQSERTAHSMSSGLDACDAETRRSKFGRIRALHDEATLFREKAKALRRYGPFANLRELL